VVAAPHPILDATWVRRDLPETRAFELALARTIYDAADARRIAGTGGLRPEQIDVTGPPSTFWARILDTAASAGALRPLVDAIAAEPINRQLADAITAVRAVATAGSLQSGRLLLDGNRPFLGRKNLREVLPELQDWKSAASVLVVRGAPDTGRTETQTLLADLNPDRFVLLHENLPLRSTMRSIWKAAGVQGDLPVPGAEPSTTESALLIDFWTDVADALESQNRRLWVLFDDLDKGPGRVEVRALAEVAAIRMREVAFQRRLRLVLLGYPDPALPQKVQAALVRNDTTEDLSSTDVQAFLDYCLTRAGKNFDPAALPTTAGDLCAKAQREAADAKAAGRDVPYHEALNGVLKTWYATEVR
jgi:hypothetical protein